MLQPQSRRNRSRVSRLCRRLGLEADFGVEGDDVAAGRDHQRIDLGQGRVALQQQPRQLHHHVRALGVGFLAGVSQAKPVRQPPRLKCRQPQRRGDLLFEDFLRRLFGDLLDLDAAFARCHQHGHAGLAVDGQANVQFSVDPWRRLANENLADRLAVRAGLMRYQDVAEHLAGEFSYFIGARGQMHAAL